MAGRLHFASRTEKQFLDDAVFAAERAKGKNCPVRKKKRYFALLGISFWENVKLKLLKRHELKNLRLQNSLGASLSLFAVNR